MEDTAATSNFAGLRVLSLESRRAAEMEKLIVTYGGLPCVAPSMSERKLDISSEVAAFGVALRSGKVQALACLTGVGTRSFLRSLSESDLALLRGVPLLARGAKPWQALKEFGLSGQLVAKPYTWREVAQALEQCVAGQRVYILEYGDPMPPPMRARLQAAGLDVRSVAVYRTAFPADTAPLSQALASCLAGQQDIALLISGTQALHFLQFAEQRAQRAELIAALNAMVVVSIGPACSETLGELGISVDLEAQPHKMGPLVQQAAQHSAALVAAKRLLA